MSALKDPVYVIKDGVQYKGPGLLDTPSRSSTQAKK
jgi:hypothetical protein